MRYLLDTHVLLWMLQGDSRLSRAATETICDERNALFFSVASQWEMCIKISLGKLELARDWPRIIETQMERNAIDWLPLRKEHPIRLLDLPYIHRDPFDRLLICQALHEGLTLITGDGAIAAYDVPVVW